jgi:hypothetical protein
MLNLPGCLESGASNIVNISSSAAEAITCVVQQRTSAADAVVVQCSWAEPVFGGKAGSFWRQAFALKEVPFNSSIDAWDGMATEGASPIVHAAPVSSTKLTFPAGTTGRFCTVLSASCLADREAAIKGFSKQTFNRTCIDIAAFVAEKNETIVASGSAEWRANGSVLLLMMTIAMLKMMTTL